MLGELTPHVPSVETGPDVLVGKLDETVVDLDVLVGELDEVVVGPGVLVSKLNGVVVGVCDVSIPIQTALESPAAKPA